MGRRAALPGGDKPSREGQKAPRDPARAYAHDRPLAAQGTGLFPTDLRDLFPPPKSLVGESLSFLVGVPSFTLLVAPSVPRRHGGPASPSPWVPLRGSLLRAGLPKALQLRI